MESDIITILGQQYRRATWPRRIAARLIDIFVVIGIWMVGTRILGDGWLAFAVPLAIIYLLIGNALFGGRSLGKRLIGIRIVERRHGGPCSVIQDLVRHRYLFFANPIVLLLTAYDASQGCFDEPELYVVFASPLTSTERETLKEKPAKLDLAGMRASLQQARHEGDNAKNQG